jgi:pyrroloquinoline quinone (PQQ) biosynthesis protein C
MNTHDTLRTVFTEAMAGFTRSSAMRTLAEGRITLDQYKSVLREIYHYAKEDPQIQALATVFFRGDDRDTVKLFLKHAISEIGHDRIALADLAALGEDISLVPLGNPLPATIALTAFPFYQIQYANPVGYLGYLYFLEHMPTAAGETYSTALAATGVPTTAMTFLHEHMTVDVAHNKLMEEYITRLVRTKADLAAVSYALRVTAELYGAMLSSAMDAATAMQVTGVRYEEALRVGTLEPKLGLLQPAPAVHTLARM